MTYPTPTPTPTPTEPPPLPESWSETTWSGTPVFDCDTQVGDTQDVPLRVLIHEYAYDVDGVTIIETTYEVDDYFTITATEFDVSTVTGCEPTPTPTTTTPPPTIGTPQPPQVHTGTEVNPPAPPILAETGFDPAAALLAAVLLASGLALITVSHIRRLRNRG